MCDEYDDAYNWFVHIVLLIESITVWLEHGISNCYNYDSDVEEEYAEVDVLSGLKWWWLRLNYVVLLLLFFLIV